MSLTKFKWPAFATTVLAVLGLASILAPLRAGAVDKEPAGKTVPATKSDLTPESFPSLFALVRPQATEWRHLRVHWMTDVVAARKLAAKEDRPIIVLYTGGAGYNEPLGIC
jgi:hypothetical protein